MRLLPSCQVLGPSSQRKREMASQALVLLVLTQVFQATECTRASTYVRRCRIDHTVKPLSSDTSIIRQSL